jgi:riboflavin kinase/FMN adenylyltransferase
MIGEQVGRKLGFPTANLKIEEEKKLIPADGVYAIKVSVEEGDHYFLGMLNIGVRPTFDGKKRTIEAHIFDFDKEIYGKKIRIFFHEMIRHERRFKNFEDLRAQLKKDKEKVLEVARERIKDFK